MCGAVGDDAVAQLADLQERTRTAEQRLTEIAREIEDLERTLVSEDELAESLAAFDPVWDSLSPREQARVIELLIERVDFDARGQAGSQRHRFPLEE